MATHSHKSASRRGVRARKISRLTSLEHQVAHSIRQNFHVNAQVSQTVDDSLHKECVERFLMGEEKFEYQISGRLRTELPCFFLALCFVFTEIKD